MLAFDEQDMSIPLESALLPGKPIHHSRPRSEPAGSDCSERGRGVNLHQEAGRRSNRYRFTATRFPEPSVAAES